MSATPSPAMPVRPTPAATVIVLRDAAGGPEALMLHRNSTSAFGGMWVFPGGKVDPADTVADRTGDLDELATARRAAAREAAEEAAVTLDPGALVAFSHWTPPAESPRRFSTWFFVTTCPPSATVTVDGAEIRDHGWLRPADAIARRDAGEIELAAPTWVTLWRLAGAADARAAIEDARRRQPARYATHLIRSERGPVAVWHGDAAYEDGDLGRPGPRHRLAMLPTGWRYEGP